MDTTIKALSVQDIIESMEGQIKTWFVKQTMSREEIAKAIIKKAENQALFFRHQAIVMREAKLNIKDGGDNRESRLEMYERQMAERKQLGIDLTREKNALLTQAGKTEADVDVQALTMQIDQVAAAYKALVENREYILLETTYEKADKAYAQAVENARQAETTFTSLNDSLPALMQSLEVYDQTEKLAADNAKVNQPFSAAGFLNDVMGDVDKAETRGRAAADVERDIAPETKNDPVADMIAARNAKTANADVLAMFEDGAAKVAKKIK